MMRSRIRRLVGRRASHNVVSSRIRRRFTLFADDVQLSCDVVDIKKISRFYVELYAKVVLVCLFEQSFFVFIRNDF